MATIRGGRKRDDKGPGRNHWSPRKGINAHRAINGISNSAGGQWLPIDKIAMDGKIKHYYQTMAEVRTFRNEENVSARKRRGRHGGKKNHAA